MVFLKSSMEWLKDRRIGFIDVLNGSKLKSTSSEAGLDRAVFARFLWWRIRLSGLGAIAASQEDRSGLQGSVRHGPKVERYQVAVGVEVERGAGGCRRQSICIDVAHNRAK